MKVVVKKDGHHFYTHINQFVVDLAKCPPHNQDNKNIEPEKDCRGKDATCCNFRLPFYTPV